MINIVSGSKNIVELWREHYSKLFNDPTQPITEQIGNRDEANLVSTNVVEILNALKYLNSSSSPGHDGLTLQHLTEAHPVLKVFLSLLITSCFCHSYLPGAFILVMLAPLIKDKNGDHSDMSNYKPIALATVISKVTEAILLERCKKYLSTSDI